MQCLISVKYIRGANNRLSASKTNGFVMGDPISQDINAIKLVEHKRLIILNLT